MTRQEDTPHLPPDRNAPVLERRDQRQEQKEERESVRGELMEGLLIAGERVDVG